MHGSEDYVSQTLLKKKTIDSWQVELKRKQISQTWNEYEGLWDKTVMLLQNMKRMHLRPSVNFLKAVLSSAVKLIIKIGQQITVAKF